MAVIAGFTKGGRWRDLKGWGIRGDVVMDWVVDTRVVRFQGPCHVAVLGVSSGDGASRKRAFLLQGCFILAWFDCFHCFDRDVVLCLILISFLAQSMLFACAHFIALIYYKYNTSLGLPNSSNAICELSLIWTLQCIYHIC